MQVHVISECHVDTALAKFFVKDNILVNHESGQGNVGNAMKKASILENIVLVGWIDDDKVKHSYFNDFQTIIHENNIILKQKSDTNEYLIVIQPAAEKFLIEAANEVNLNFQLYNLPEDFKGFKNRLKNPSIEQDADFQRFINDLMLQNASSFVTLSSFFEDKKNSKKIF
jgi:hypothetical protein